MSVGTTIEFTAKVNVTKVIEARKISAVTHIKNSEIHFDQLCFEIDQLSKIH